MEKTAFLFAGQGSQYVGMGKDLYETFPESKLIFNQACDALGLDLAHLCFEGPHEALKATAIAQPAIVTMTIAALEVFRKRHAASADYCAGLSLGEYSALIAAGALRFRDAIKVIKKRGEIMEEVAKKNPGKMAAVLDLPIEKIREVCELSGAEIANINCPGQVVITGKSLNISNAAALCREKGAKRVVELEVSGGFHSSLMLEAAEKLKQVLSSTALSDAKIPVIANVTAQPEVQAGLIRENLIKQVHSSVRWEESIRFMLSQGVTKFFEFGPGKVLKGLLRRIDPNVAIITIEHKEDILNYS